MSERKLRYYGYVDRPYERVRPLIRERASELFQRATTAAAARADALTATLRANVGALEIGVDVRIHVGGVRDDPSVAGLAPVTRMALRWEAARGASFFPAADVELSLWPLTANETELEITGTYRPPLGALGDVLDTVALHRIAEATIHRFVEEVLEQIRREIPTR